MVQLGDPVALQLELPPQATRQRPHGLLHARLELVVERLDHIPCRPLYDPLQLARLFLNPLLHPPHLLVQLPRVALAKVHASVKRSLQRVDPPPNLPPPLLLRSSPTLQLRLHSPHQLVPPVLQRLHPVVHHLQQVPPFLHAGHSSPPHHHPQFVHLLLHSHHPPRRLLLRLLPLLHLLREVSEDALDALRVRVALSLQQLQARCCRRLLPALLPPPLLPCLCLQKREPLPQLLLPLHPPSNFRADHLLQVGAGLCPALCRLLRQPPQL
mmetsp:Transcript_24304/g.79327  ORF Transcript_24304/g.79327 Transcript_24304/m.79327 type:complete len:269 (+) Transcript_24304:437-1243(+)